MIDVIYNNIILTVVLVAMSAFILLKYGYSRQGFSNTNLILTYILIVMLINIMDGMGKLYNVSNGSDVVLTDENFEIQNVEIQNNTDVTDSHEAFDEPMLSSNNREEEPYLKINSKTLEGKISLRTGSIEILRLKQYLDSNDQPAQIFDSKGQYNKLTLELYDLDNKRSMLNDRQSWEVMSSSSSSNMQTSENRSLVVLSPQNPVTIRAVVTDFNGIEVIISRTFTLVNDYMIHISDSLTNAKDNTLKVYAYSKISRSAEESEDAGSLMTRDEIVAQSNNELQTIDYDDLSNGARKFEKNNRWLVFSDVNWLVGMVFNDTSKASNTYALHDRKENTYNLVYRSHSTTLLPQREQHLQTWQLLVTAKTEQLLTYYERTIPAQNLSQTKDWGWLSFINFPIYKALEMIYRLVHNYGWSIIILTILIRFLLSPLTFKVQKSSRIMQIIKPKMEQIRELYKDHPEQMNSKIVSLYREYKVNPFSSLLFIIPQIPIMYSIWSLMKDISFNNQPFIFWINNMSGVDSFVLMHMESLGITINFLGLITSLSLYFGLFRAMQRSMQLTYKSQVAILAICSWLFSYLTAGMCIYLICNNIITPVQNWLINKMLDRQS